MLPSKDRGKVQSMFNRLSIAAFAATILAAGPCFAQDEAPASAAEIAAASAQADRLIAAGNAGRYFENITTDGAPRVRHKASGLTCSFSDETYDRISIIPAQGGLAEGEDVGCHTRLLNVDISLYATRYARRYDASFIVQDAMRAIVQRWPDAKPFEGDLITATSGDAPAPLIAGFNINVEGQPKLTLVLVSHRDDWSFKGRVTGPADDETPTNMLGAVIFLTSLPGAPD